MRILLSTKERSWAIPLARALDGEVLFVDLTPGDRTTAEMLGSELPIYDVQDVLDGMIELKDAAEEVKGFSYLAAPAKTEKWNLNEENAPRLLTDAFSHTILMAEDPYVVYPHFKGLFIDTGGRASGDDVFDFRLRKGATYLGKAHTDARIEKNIEVLCTGEEKLGLLGKIRRALL